MITTAILMMICFVLGYAVSHASTKGAIRETIKALYDAVNDGDLKDN